MFNIPFPVRRALGVAAIAALCGPAQAGLVGQTLTGELYLQGFAPNYFDPANGLVPPTAGNAGGTAVVVGAPVEFGAGDPSATITADFSDDRLLIQESAFVNGAAGDWVMRFTSATAGLFQTLSLLASDFAPGLDYQLSGDTLEIRWAGGATVQPGSVLSATFEIGSAVAASVPEPGSLALVALALAAAGARESARRRARGR